MKQVEAIIKAVLRPSKVDRVKFGWIPDFRSRLCEAQDRLDVRFERQTKQGKRYREYWLSKKDYAKLAGK